MAFFCQRILLHILAVLQKYKQPLLTYSVSTARVLKKKKTVLFLILEKKLFFIKNTVWCKINRNIFKFQLFDVERIKNTFFQNWDKKIELQKLFY